jgi:hypothetical protein
VVDNGIYRPLFEDEASLTRCLVNSPLQGVAPVEWISIFQYEDPPA